MITPAIVSRIISSAINDEWDPNSGEGKFNYTYQVSKAYSK